MKDVKNILKDELLKCEDSLNITRKEFLDFTAPYIDSDGNIDFDKLASDGKLEEYNDLCRYSTRDRVMHAAVKKILNENTEIQPLIVDPIGFDLESCILEAEKFDLKMSPETEKKLSEIEQTSKPAINVGNNSYNVRNIFKIREKADFYIDCIMQEVSLATGFKIGTDEYNDALKTACTSVIDEINKKYFAQKMVDEMANGTLDVNGQSITQNNDIGSNMRTMGFSGIWLLGLITGIASCGIVILGMFLR